MISRAKGIWLNLSQSLGFVPGVVVVAFAALGIGLTEIDSHVDLQGNTLVFQGDGPAARTVLSVIAGSLITVAGLTFSITMVVLQLASSQFSPRILRTMFGDRVTQITIGTFVGTFVYSILALRAVGSFGDAGFVPRLSVTVASLLGIAAVVLLIVFLHHISTMVQVSHVSAGIARATMARIDVLHPEDFAVPATDERPEERVEAWRAAAPPGRVRAHRPGYVQRVDLEGLAAALGHDAGRVAVLVCPGDFVAADQDLVEIWPAGSAKDCSRAVRNAVAIGSERDMNQDPGFGLRQLADTALRALSPGINDPMTAVTCIGYIRTILVRLAERADPPALQNFPDPPVAVVARRRAFSEYLDSSMQIGRYAAADAWVADELLAALQATAATALAAGSPERAEQVRVVARAIAQQAGAEAKTDHDRELIERRLAAVEALGDG